MCNNRDLQLSDDPVVGVCVAKGYYVIEPHTYIHRKLAYSACSYIPSTIFCQILSSGGVHDV